MKFPKVTIMIPTYNQAQYIAQSIESALAQDYPNIEIVVSDDCSTDETNSIVALYLSDPRVKYFRNETNLGRVCHYRKILYEYTTGDWTLNLDGDDYLSNPLFISRAVEAAAKYENIVLVVAGSQTISESDGFALTYLPTRDQIEYVAGSEFFLRWGVSTPVSHLSSLYKRDIALKLGFYREDILSSDAESLRRLVLHGNVLLLGQVAGVHRVHEKNASKTLSLSAHIANLKSVLAPYQYALSLGLPKGLLNRWKTRNLVRLAKRYLRGCLDNGQISDAWKMLKYFRRHHREDWIPLLIELFSDKRIWIRVLLRLLGGRHLITFGKRIRRLSSDSFHRLFRIADH